VPDRKLPLVTTKDIMSGEVRKDLAHYFEKKKAGKLGQPDDDLKEDISAIKG
jgi:AGCS family alanine or glycine:cation symporter